MVDYNPSIPQASDNLSTSQGQILNNFTQLDNIFAFDHFTWDDPTTANRGLHKQIDFPVPTTVSSPTGTASVSYSKLVGGVGSLYFDNSAGSSCVWRGGLSTGLVALTPGVNGSMTLPNGVIMKWGNQSSITDNVPINFPTPFPSTCWAVTVSGYFNSTVERSIYVKPGSLGASSFTCRTDSGSMGVIYWAIGN